MKTTHLSMQKAIAVAEQLDDGEFTAAVEDAKRLGLASVEIVTTDEDGKSDIYVLRPEGVMIAWKPRNFERDRIKIVGGTPKAEIHMTLIYLGHLEDFDTDQQRTIIGVVTEVAQKHQTITGKMNGIGRFYDTNEDGEQPVWLGGDFPGLRELREDIAGALREAGITWEDKHPTFTPHVTIGWVPEDSETLGFTINPYETCIDNVTVYFGGLEYEIDLDGPDWQKADAHGPYFDGEYEPNLYVPVLKEAAQPVMDDVKKYTYGPWYVPDSVDLHNEWASRDDVQEALWKYVETGDRDIRLQHDTSIVAGHWVELATVPFPVSVPVENEQGVMVKHTYPAGTPFMGVIWEDWAWNLVEQGLIKGYSIGGSAARMLVDMPAAEADAAVAKSRA
ncbi:capsid maturation protease [Microbacterium phage ValentiniPuff]|uniref:Capsid maturation protease n=1 Tax=Microbacterium phage ValentiniPuff TaxID=2315705 RepID=A0A386KS59_9CAUD|nr:capsid maturation protease [Microbacterium phage ValentiniPuff]